jgi:Mg-chelatase subunit ChlD
MGDCRPCRHAAGCRMFACTFSHPPGRARLCKFGAGCRKLRDAEHCKQFLHAKPSGGGAARSGGGGDGGGRQLAVRRDAGCALAVRGGGSHTRREVTRDKTVVREKLVKTVPKVNDVAVVLDLSGSMSGSKHAQALSSLRDLFAHTLGPQDRLSIFTFNRVVTQVLPFTPKIDIDLDPVLASIGSCGGRTRLFDAIGAALDTMATAKGRSLQLVALTDGADNCSDTTQDAIAARIASPGVGCFHFVGLAVGSEGRQVLEALCAPQLCKLIPVEDNAAGVKQAFGKAMKHIVEVRERVDETVSITETRHTGQTRPRIGGARGKPGPGYVCHLCGKPGHWKEQCWTAKRG